MSDYELPDPQDDKQWVSCVVLSLKTLKGVDYDDRSWDKANWGRAAKAAKTLLEITGSLRAADACLVDVSRDLNDKGLSWTLETVCRFAHEWIARKRGVTDGRDVASRRERLFKAIAERRANPGAGALRKAATGREVLDTAGGAAGFENPLLSEESGTGRSGATKEALD